MFHQHYTIVDTMQKKLDQKIFDENLHAAYPYPLHYLRRREYFGRMIQFMLRNFQVGGGGS